MIVDCHTHVWESPRQLGEEFNPLGRWARERLQNGRPGALDASLDRHRLASQPVDKTFVLGFKSRHLRAEIPNDLIVRYVRQHPDKLIGFAGIDPTNLSEALDDLHRAHDEFGLKGITVSPASQDFHPADSRAMQVFAEAARLEMPVLVHQGIQGAPASKMDFARPVLLDEVCRELPKLKIVIAHLGDPWIDECIVMLGRHGNLYADVSGLLHRPWRAYNALLGAHEYGVMDKLLFGSDFPYNSATTAIESLYRLNQLVTGTNLPTVPRQLLAAIVQRNALAVLGIQSPGDPVDEADNGAVLDAHD